MVQEDTIIATWTAMILIPKQDVAIWMTTIRLIAVFVGMIIENTYRE